jgi:hypothetical protein
MDLCVCYTQGEVCFLLSQHFASYSETANSTVKWLTLLLRIWEVPCSNLGAETGSIDCMVSLVLPESFSHKIRHDTFRFLTQVMMSDDALLLERCRCITTESVRCLTWWNEMWYDGSSVEVVAHASFWVFFDGCVPHFTWSLHWTQPKHILSESTYLIFWKFTAVFNVGDHVLQIRINLFYLCTVSKALFRASFKKWALDVVQRSVKLLLTTRARP